MTQNRDKKEWTDPAEGGADDPLWQALDLLPQADLPPHFTASTLARIEKEQTAASGKGWFDQMGAVLFQRPWQLASATAICLLAIVSFGTFWAEQQASQDFFLAEQLEPEDIPIVEQLDTLLALEENELWIAAFQP
ncbi:MAG: hypothetical protein SNJ52_05690 [Verrucomicrobiia bacterium]